MSGRTIAISLLLVGLLAAAAVGALSLRGGPPASATFERYARDWSRGADGAAAALTDRAAVARRALAASRDGLDGARVSATVGDVTEDGDDARAALAVRWQVPGIGAWSYRTTLRAAREGDGWQVRWRSTNVHPGLKATSRLGTVREAARRGAILDRSARALVANRAVVHVDVKVGRDTAPAATARRIAALVDVGERRLASLIRRAPAGRFIPVITLRKADYDDVATELAAVPGISIAPDTAPLAPTKTFGRALLGAVGPVTAEQVKAARGRLGEGDEIGQWGLQAAFEPSLAATGDGSIVIRDRGDGSVLDTLRRVPGKRGQTLRTTLDLDVQRAAERALGDMKGKAALVAVQPSSGDILAVANRPGDSSLNRAFTGLYPPGSTFKVITTAALLRDGLSVDETVDCPKTRVVDGRAFRNFEGSARGAVPFRTDFAQSCNTAFIGLAGRLSATALTDVARDFGFGREVRLRPPAADGRVPSSDDPVARAAMMIGQDRIVASPLTMAGVAATVADGRWRAPRLVDGDPRASAGPLPASEAATLRELMRSVVTGGTGTALAGVPGEVAGKSGTAEYGSGDPPPTHAWFIAYRANVAIAVLVEKGRSGGEVAAPIAKRFFDAFS